MHKPDGTNEKIKIQMCNTTFKNGAPQPLYFPDGYERAGAFKGMAKILEEWGCGYMSKVHAECKGFKCLPLAINCCCCRILYNEPDFINVETILESICRVRSFKLLFLPKFHCELNFIEQCWGYSKQIYQLNPESSHEDALEKNMLAALEAVPLKSMCKFANRSCRCMNSYMHGLNGTQAVWAARVYKGHWVVPMNIMEELGKKGIIESNLCHIKPVSHGKQTT
jgi:hypothetical protein